MLCWMGALDWDFWNRSISASKGWIFSCDASLAMSPIKKAKPFCLVQVLDPVKQGEGVSAFVTFKVRTFLDQRMHFSSFQGPCAPHISRSQQFQLASIAICDGAVHAFLGGCGCRWADVAGAAYRNGRQMLQNGYRLKGVQICEKELSVRSRALDAQWLF